MTTPPLTIECCRGRHIICALSGGSDSVALLLLLKDAADRGEIRLSAAHFDHCIRGEESRGDAEFCIALCARLGIPLLHESGDVPALARSAGCGIEQAAREARYAFLRRAQTEVGADYIALAHHSGDQAETVLMHLLRGSGLTGARGMLEQREGLIRPVLSARKSELRAYLAEKGESFCEDSTNECPDTPRNALRLRVMPELSAIYPGCERALNRFANIVRREDDYLSHQTEQYLRSNRSDAPFGWFLELGAHPAVTARSVLAGVPSLTYDDVERVLSLCEYSCGALEAAGGHRFERHKNRLYYIMPGYRRAQMEVPVADGAELPGMGRIHLRPGGGVPIRDDPYREMVDARALLNSVLRTRRPGDVIRPFGMSGTKKLSDYFIDRKIDRPLRDGLALVAKGSEILWIPGVGLSESLRATEASNSVEIFFAGVKLLP